MNLSSSTVAILLWYMLRKFHLVFMFVTKLHDQQAQEL
jgi:hypothetical protein